MMAQQQLNMQMSQLQLNNDNDDEQNNPENDNEFFGLTEDEETMNKEREKEGKVAIKPLGCGKQINWCEMEDCSDEVIEKLREIAVDDYHAGLLKISDEMNKKK